MTKETGQNGLQVVESEGLSTEVECGLRGIRRIHLAGEIKRLGDGTKIRTLVSEFVISPTVHTADLTQWDKAIDRVGQALAPFNPEVQHTVIGEGGTMEFPYINIWRADGVRDERVSVLFVPTEAFGLSIVKYCNRQGGEVDPDFERRACMVTPDELGLVMANHSLHSPEYRKHHK